MGSKLLNSPVMDFGGTMAFQIPSPRPAAAVAGCACVTVAAQQAAAISADSHGLKGRGSCIGLFQQRSPLFATVPFPGHGFYMRVRTRIIAKKGKYSLDVSEKNLGAPRESRQ
jgi:hypothetical protein